MIILRNEIQESTSCWLFSGSLKQKSSTYNPSLESVEGETIPWGGIKPFCPFRSMSEREFYHVATTVC